MAKVVETMIPVLFSASETNFTHNGIGRLVDCLSCKVTEERNGIYECEFQYPVNGRLFQQLIQGGIIGVTHDDTGDVQPFDIYRHSAEIGGIVTFNARHISYRLNGITVSRFTASSCAAALAAIGTNSAQPNPFSFSTDKTIEKTYDSGGIKAARSVLMGEAGSILQSFQGEYKFDKWTVSLLTSRGSDTGVTVRYGKNMTGITWERDETNCFNAVAPFWTDGTNTVSLPEVYVQPTTPISPVICVPLDMSQMISGQPTVAELRQAAIDYLDEKQPWKPYDKISVNFVAMWQSPEYESIAAIQRISLCDTVSIYWTEMGIVAEKAKVVRIVYDVLAERYDSMEVGSVSSEFVAITTDVQSGDGGASAGAVTSVNGQTGDVWLDIPSGVAVQDDAPTDDELVWVDTDDSGTFYTIPEVDDDNVSPEDTWSSQKIDSMYSSGTNNGWTYIKIGTKCVAFYYNQVTEANVTTQWVTGTYRSGELWAAPFPTFLKSGYRVFGAGAAGSQDSGIDFGRVFISSDAIRFYMTCTQSKTNCNFPLMVVAIGDWNG